MKLSTPVHIPKSEVRLQHEQPITIVGSCFAESIGDKLAYHKFNCTKNPFGIIYNPISLAKALKRIIDNKPYSKEELVQVNEKWVSLDHHGSFSKLSQADCLNTINQALHQAHKTLLESSTLIITFGSAWVYEYGENRIVANCHKIPAKAFKKRLLGVDEIRVEYQQLIEQLKAFNEKLQLIFTVSPVRHAKDGLHENSLSKSTLHLGIHQLTENNLNCSYFPAYELVIDELRDYRFYKDDLLHPSELTVDYIWEKFSSCYFNEATKKLNTEISSIQRALAHRPIERQSEAHQRFLEDTKKKISALEKTHPFIRF